MDIGQGVLPLDLVWASARSLDDKVETDKQKDFTIVLPEEEQGSDEAADMKDPSNNDIEEACVQHTIDLSSGGVLRGQARFTICVSSYR